MNIQISIDKNQPSWFPHSEMSAYSHFQSPDFIPLLSAYNQIAYWLSAYNKDTKQPLAVWLVYATPSNIFTPSQNWLAKKLDCHLIAMHGPSFHKTLSPTERHAIYPSLLKAFETLSRNITALTTTIYLNPTIPSEDLHAWEGAASSLNLKKTPHYTYAAALPSTETEMFKQIKADRRTKIRKSEKENIEFVVGTTLEDLRAYYNVRCETISRNNTDHIPWQHFEDTWHAMTKANCFQVFLAKQRDRIGAGQIAYIHNGYVHLTGVSAASWTYQEKVPANDFLQWHVIKWSIKNNYHTLDFVGANPNSVDPKLKAIDHFKSRWGTELHQSIKIEWPSRRYHRLLLSLMTRLFR